MNFYLSLIRNHPLANIAFVVVLVMGFFSYNMMPRERDPEINFNWLVVTATLPGAAAVDVEKKLTDPLEEAIARIPDIRFISSNSSEGISTSLVRFRDISERIYDKRINDLRREIQTAADRELPEEANLPDVMEITTSNGFPTVMILVEGRDADENLRATARRIKTDLERMAGIDKVFATGLSDPELHINFRPEALASRGLNAANLADGISGWFRDTSAGVVQVADEEWLLRVFGQENDPDYIAGLTVFAPQVPGVVGSPNPVSIESVAEVTRAREKPTTLVARDGNPAVLLAVTKKNYTNTLELVQRINSYLDQENTRLASSGIGLSMLDDQTVDTEQAIKLMERNALQGLMLVLLITWLFLGSRIAILISLGIPFALAGTFWLLYSAGYTLNLTVLLGIIIALGMLVDDAVVMVEDIYYRMVRGEEAQSACVSAIRSVGVPVLASVLTTIAAFLPLMLLPGIVGQFMQVVPFVVTIALLVSLLEAYWMLPTHVVVIRPNFQKPSRLHGWRTRFTHGLRVKYARLLMRVFRHPKKFFGAIILLFILALASIFGGLVKTQFFAADPIRMFYVNIDMPTGTSLEATLQEVSKLEKEVGKYLKPEELRAIASYSGTKFTETDQLLGNAYGQVVVSLAPRTSDSRQPDEIVAEMRDEIEAMPLKGKASFTMLSGGPPSSKPIKLRLRGDNYDELRAAADALRAKVSQIEGVRDLTDDDLPGRNELVLRVDEEAVKATGLSPAVIARLVRLHTDGEIAAETRSQGEKVEVRVKAKTNAIIDVEDALAAPVALVNGEITTLASLVKTESRVAKGVIKHYDLRRAITVEADLDKSIIDTVQANEKAREAWDIIALNYPGVMIDYSGELDDIIESLDAMLVLFLMGVGLIYLILAAQFRSYWQPLMVISTVPMALIGVTAGLLLSGNPLSLYTLYGIIALVGIAVNASIVLIDAANHRLEDGMSVIHAAVYAARRRVVPVIITTTTTIGGLIWLALGVGGKSLIWGPLAAAIVWGLTISTALTLFVMPLLFSLVMKRSAKLVLN